MVVRRGKIVDGRIIDGPAKPGQRGDSGRNAMAGGATMSLATAAIMGMGTMAAMRKLLIR